MVNSHEMYIIMASTKTYNQFNIQSIYIYDEDAKIECSTIVKAEMIYNKDSLIMAKEKNRYLVAGYTNEYINKAWPSKICSVLSCLYVHEKSWQFIEKNDDKKEQLQRIHDSMMAYIHNNLPDDGTFVL